MIDDDGRGQDMRALLGIPDELMHFGMDFAKPGSERTAISILRRMVHASPGLERIRSAYERQVSQLITRSFWVHIPRVRRQPVPQRATSGRGRRRRAQVLQANAAARRGGPRTVKFDMQVINPSTFYLEPAERRPATHRRDLWDAMRYCFEGMGQGAERQR